MWFKENKVYLIGVFLTIVVFIFIFMVIYGGRLEMKQCIKETGDPAKCSLNGYETTR